MYLCFCFLLLEWIDRDISLCSIHSGDNLQTEPTQRPDPIDIRANTNTHDTNAYKHTQTQDHHKHTLTITHSQTHTHNYTLTNTRACISTVSYKDAVALPRSVCEDKVPTTVGSTQKTRGV